MQTTTTSPCLRRPGWCEPCCARQHGFCQGGTCDCPVPRCVAIREHPTNGGKAA